MSEFNSIRRIMRDIFLNYDHYSEESLKEKYGNEKVKQFSQFANPHYAKVWGHNKWRLTPDGNSALFQFQKEALQNRFNLLIVIFTCLIAVATAVNAYLAYKILSGV